MEKDYKTALELFFTYGYECCVFKHNIYGDQPEVLDGMPDSVSPIPLGFFASPRCPPVRSSSAVVAAEVQHRDEEPARSALARDLNGTS